MRPANRSYDRRPKLCAMQMEGIVSKNVAAPNRSDRNEAWLKIRCVQRGFSDRRLREGSAGVAALHLGQREGDEMRYIGKVGTGFTRKSSIEIRWKLDAIKTAKSPPDIAGENAEATWVEPKYVADVEYRDVAAEGYLRHSSFKGLREDR